MANIILTTPHRVGSRWIHYLLKDLYGMSASPEMDGSKIKDGNELIFQRFAENRVVKFHRAPPSLIFNDLKPIDYFVIGIVRNPRDRAVSYAFHNRYHDKMRNTLQQKAKSDADAVKITVFEDKNFALETAQQIEMMETGYSTKDKTNTELPYIWTTYEWLKEDILQQISIIAKFIDAPIAIPIATAIGRNSFKYKSGREPGQESRDNLWRRKGVNGDWENWFTDEMIKATEEDDKQYWSIVNKLNGY